MDDTTTYYKDIPKQIYELLADNMGDMYQYFLGSPLSLSRDAYPCVAVQSVGSSTTAKGAPTGFDDITENINIYVMKLDQDSTASTGTTDTIMRNLYNSIEGRDPATGQYMTDTVQYILRTNINIGATTIDHDISVNYDVARENDKNVAIAIVTVSATARVPVTR